MTKQCVTPASHSASKKTNDVVYMLGSGKLEVALAVLAARDWLAAEKAWDGKGATGVEGRRAVWAGLFDVVLLLLFFKAPELLVLDDV